MSFVPAPQQASAAANNNLNNAAFLSNNNAPPPNVTPDAATAVVSDQELVFKIRTFDVYWVEKKALMYRDGIAKVSCIFMPLRIGPWAVGGNDFSRQGTALFSPTFDFNL
jgi:hypothetical protein